MTIVYCMGGGLQAYHLSNNAIRHFYIIANRTTTTTTNKQTNNKKHTHKNKVSCWNLRALYKWGFHKDICWASSPQYLHKWSSVVCLVSWCWLWHFRRWSISYCCGKEYSAINTKQQTSLQEVFGWSSSNMMLLNTRKKQQQTHQENVITTRQMHQRGLPPPNLL